LATAITRQSQLRIERSLDRQLPQLPPDQELLVYRVAQESVTNVVRHAHAETAWLELRRVPGAVELVIEDDGRGLPLALPPLSGGLRGLRERALASDAALRVSDRAGRGTRVELRVPVGS